MQAQVKKKLLKNILKSVPSKGWSIEALEHGAIKAGYDKEYSELVFSAGVKEALEFYIRTLDEEMIVIPLKETRISLRVKEMLINRIMLMSSNKPLTQKTISFLALPWNFVFSLKLLWHTMDLIWYNAGYDASTDYNYYTKRSLLASIYLGAVMYMLADESENLADTINFIDRKFIDIAKIKKRT